MFKFLERRQEDSDSELNGSEHSLNLICFLIPSWMQFWYVTVIPKYLNFATKLY
jgi:hypothetical protein